MLQQVAGARETGAGGGAVAVGVAVDPGMSATGMTSTARGAVTTSATGADDGVTRSWQVSTEVPAGVRATLSVDGAGGATGVLVDGQTRAVGTSGVTASLGALVVTLDAGPHALTISAPTGVRTDLLVLRRGNTYLMRHTLSSGAAETSVGYGRPGDTVLVGKVF